MNSLYYLILGIPAVLLHEMAHVLAATALDVRVKRFGISWKGPYVVREQGAPFANFCIALAGPALNLFLAITFWTFAPQFGLVNMVLGLYNLMPFIPGLDGHRALAAYRKFNAQRQSNLA